MIGFTSSSCGFPIVLAVALFLAASPSAGAASGNCFSRVTRVLTERLGIAAHKVTPSAKLADDLGADKLDKVEIVMASEEEFGISIPAADARRLVTVGDLIAYFSERGRCTL